MPTLYRIVDLPVYGITPTGAELMEISSAGSGSFQLSLNNLMGIPWTFTTGVIFNKSGVTYTSPIDSATINVIGDSTFGGGISLFSFHSHHSNLAFFTTASAVSPSTQTALVANNTIGTQSWYGSDGVAAQSGAFFQAAAESNWSAGSAPTMFNWWTAVSGSVTPVVRMVFSSTGNLSIGDFSAYSGSGQAFRSLSGRPLELVKLNAQPWYVAYAFAADNSNVPAFLGRKSRATTVGGTGAVTANDLLTLFGGYGDDGTTFQQAVRLDAVVDGSVSTGIVPGRWVINTANASGVLTEAARVNSGGSFMMSASALATTATDGFIYINSCAGTPTGVPSAAPGGAKAIVYDTTANKIWIYNGSWRGVAVT